MATVYANLTLSQIPFLPPVRHQSGPYACKPVLMRASVLHLCAPLAYARNRHCECVAVLGTLAFFSLVPTVVTVSVVDFSFE